VITPEQFLVMQMLERSAAGPARFLDDDPRRRHRPQRTRRPGRYRRATAAALRRTSDALRAAAARLAPEPAAGTCEPSPA
jgi:hypothetical protein